MLMRSTGEGETRGWTSYTAEPKSWKGLGKIHLGLATLCTVPEIYQKMFSLVLCLVDANLQGVERVKLELRARH